MLYIHCSFVFCKPQTVIHQGIHHAYSPHVYFLTQCVIKCIALEVHITSANHPLLQYFINKKRDSFSNNFWMYILWNPTLDTQQSAANLDHTVGLDLSSERCIKDTLASYWNLQYLTSGLVASDTEAADEGKASLIPSSMRISENKNTEATTKQV